MRLREKFVPFVYCFLGSGMLTNSYNENVVEHYSKECEKLCDEFAVGFTEWVMMNMSDPKFPSYKNSELLRMYKEQNNL